MAECFGLGRESLQILLIVSFLAIFNGVSHAVEYNVVEAAQATRQSSVHEEQDSDLVNDGNVSTCSLTEKEKAFWKIDLGRPNIISGIKLAQGVSVQVDVFVTNEQWKFENDQHVARSGACKYGMMDNARVSCYRPMVGQYIMIFSTSPASLNLCDFQAYECQNGYFGPKCETKCQCKNDALCAKQSGKCPTGCKAGYQGEDCQQECENLTFGENCAHTCHCLYNLACDKQKGECNAGCANGWLGTDCQTELPRLIEKPTKLISTPHSISLRWPSWNQTVHSNMDLIYKIFYRKRGDKDWVNSGSYVLDTQKSQESYKVADLELNTRYAFKVTPVIRNTLTPGEETEGQSSPVVEYFKTQCSEPDPPSKLSVTPGVDYSTGTPRAMVMVQWLKPQPSGVHCDSIRYFEIFYHKLGENDAIPRKASKDDEMKNVTDLDFDADYKLMIAVENNEELQSLENPWIEFRTVPSTVVPVELQPNKTMYLIVGLLAGFVVLMVIVLTAVLYKCRKKKKVPTATLR